MYPPRPRPPRARAPALPRALTLSLALRSLRSFVRSFARQVNTSGEESKHGLEPGEVVDVCRHVATQCGSLRLVGLMTIGMPDYTSRPENFQTLAACRAAVAEALGVDCGALELSMGMSGDYVQAIEMSSNNVRVGSTIFGARNYSK